MNLETISSPGGETGAACSLSSLLALGCRSKAEAAHSFAKKLHTKLWSLSPSVTDGSNQTGHCHEEKEENASTWGVAVEARFDVNSKRVETVVTSVPLITTQNHNKVLPTVVYQPSAGLSLSRQGSLDQSTGEQILYSAGSIMEHKNANHHCNSLENNGWTNYRKNDGHSSSSLVRGHDQESDTSSTTTTNPMSDSDQYFDFGIETPLDLDSAGEETVSHDNNTIVINHDDGLPVQPEGMESGCIFGSPSTLSSGEDSDELEDREEEPSFYESLSQSPASVGFKANHDRFNFGGQSHLGHVYEPVLDRPSVVNTNNESDVLGHNSSCCVGDTLTEADSNGQPDKTTAPAQSAERTPRVDLKRGPLSQGDLEDESNLRDSDESTSGPLRSQITQFSTPVLPSLSSCDSAANEDLTDNYSNNQDLEEEDEVLDVLKHFSHLKLDMVRLDPVIVDKLFSGSAPVNDTHQSSIRASSLQLDLDKDTVIGDRYSPIIDECSNSIGEEQQPTKEDDTSAKPELEEEEDDSQTSSSNDTPSTKESTPAREDEEEDEDNQRNRHRVQRSTSLKSGKTPPGTPGRKKIVRFADALGLDLALVRTFLDEVPNVPQSAFSDLSDLSVDDESCMLRTTPQSGSYIRITRRDPATNSSVTTFVNSPRILVASFTQPGNLPDFLDRVKRQKICLETACMMDESRLRGVIRVLNIDFHKSVLIRFTVDEWRTQSDQLATYVTNSCDGLSDRFSFTLAGAHSMQPGQRLIFALCYRVAGQEIWDSNQGKNYVFQCISNSNYLPSIALSSPSVSDAFLPYM